MIIGYIRVSRDKQTTALQEDAIQKAQCQRTFVDKMSGVRDDRQQFLAMLDMARRGDVIVVWRLDRLGRSLKQLIETVTQLNERGIELRACFGNRRKSLSEMLQSLEEVRKAEVRFSPLAPQSWFLLYGYFQNTL